MLYFLIIEADVLTNVCNKKNKTVLQFGVPVKVKVKVNLNFTLEQVTKPHRVVDVYT
jgi:hypothetical protein